MIYQLKQYIKFLLKSTNQHGVHSPFVYNLVTKCFYDKTNNSSYKNILNYKTELLKNKTIIKVTALKSDSNIFKQKRSIVSQIAKNTRVSDKRIKLLYRLSNYFKFENVLEINSSLGIKTIALYSANQNTNIITLESCTNTFEFTRANFKKHKLQDINLITGSTHTIIKELSINNYDLILFNGKYQEEATLIYFETLLQTVNNDSVFIFTHIYSSKGMTKAWQTIKQHPKVAVTIDTFFWGFVFFRKEQVKEHFIIRV